MSKEKRSAGKQSIGASKQPPDQVESANTRIEMKEEPQTAEEVSTPAPEEKPEGGAPDAALEQSLAHLEEENSLLKDQLLRKTADFENFRKRMFREKEEGIKYANAALLSEVITVIDDFERAIQSAEASKDFDSFHTGVAMIEKQLVSLLERNWGLKRFNSLGEEFNPERHQAIGIEETDQYDKSVVLEDYQKGYLLHDRVLRPARVKVSRPAAPGEPESKDSENDKGAENGKDNRN